MAATVKGRIDWWLNRDKDGHREYHLVSLVETDDPLDGPERVYWASGSPVIGATWAYGNDQDDWAFCWPTATVRPVITKEPNRFWTLENVFNTKPLFRCQNDSIQSPLLEPDRVGGSFVKYQKEARWDRFGNLILSSSHEPIRGLERDFNRPTVWIEQNEATLGLSTFAGMIDTLNDSTLWGLPARTIKLSNVSWERKLYGTCSYYYTRRLEFDIRFDGFDHSDIADAGYKVFDEELFSDTAGNRANPRCYSLHKDSRGENTPTKVLLDGNGSLLTDPTSPVFLPTVELYGESNFLLLGIPTSF